MGMNNEKRMRLEKAGWRVGSTRVVLELSEGEAALVEFKLALARALRSVRVAHGVTQAELATRLDSSQSRVAKMEGADPGVSLDLLVRALFALGGDDGDVVRAMRSVRRDDARPARARALRGTSR
jgi:DNA-binding XRE family transcriptional regulator